MKIIYLEMNIDNIRKDIEDKLRYLISRERIPNHLYEYMAYYPMQGGKRIRPLLLTLTSYYLGGNLEDAVTVGCCVELIHNYSLIHDDLPAMDNDDYRRGKPTCHKVFGEANAILAGDALLTYAFQILSERELFRSLTDSQLIDITNVIARKSGIWGMVLGQVLDINRHKDLIETDRYKTSALFEACFMCGGIIGNRYDKIEELEKLGNRVGLLFQFTDDLLDKDGVYELGYEYVMNMVENYKEEAISLLNEIMPDAKEIKDLISFIAHRTIKP